jgi:deoxyribonuclease-1
MLPLSGNAAFSIKNTPDGNHEISSFSEAKNVLKKTNFFGIKKTIYCSCEITSNSTYSESDCGIIHGSKYLDRRGKIEIEHIVPLSEITKNTEEYSKGSPACNGKKGRPCVEKIYGFLSGDLWNLLPSEALFNQIHKNYSWTEIPGEIRNWGSCDFEYSDRKVEPPEDLKGLIARTFYYFESVYKIKLISEKNKKLFEIWAKKPPQKWQCDRAKGIISVQKNKNIFEIDACKSVGLM